MALVQKQRIKQTHLSEASSDSVCQIRKLQNSQGLQSIGHSLLTVCIKAGCHASYNMLDSLKLFLS